MTEADPTVTSKAPILPSVMLTGHRRFTDDDTLWLRKELYRTARRLQEFHGLQEIISGMALGADTIWAETALRLKIPFAAYIPFEAQPDRWPPKQQDIWYDLRAQATREVVVGPHYSVGYLHARNDAMIKDSDLCVAAFRVSETTGGTFSAVKKVRNLNKPLLILDPETRLITKENFHL